MMNGMVMRPPFALWLIFLCSELASTSMSRLWPWPLQSNPNICFEWSHSQSPFSILKTLCLCGCVRKRERKRMQKERPLFSGYLPTAQTYLGSPISQCEGSVTTCIKTRLKETQTPWNASMVAFLFIYLMDCHLLHPHSPTL